MGDNSDIRVELRHVQIAHVKSLQNGHSPLSQLSPAAIYLMYLLTDTRKNSIHLLI